MPKKAKEEIIEEKKTAQKKADVKTSKASKSSTTKKSTAKKSTKTSSKKSTSKVSKKSTSVKKSAVKKKNTVEYYDLSNLYNQTIVKILAQTPTIIFVYWDISDEDKQLYLEKYGKDFFDNTTPFLTVTNETKGYSFEVEINDFANSWYIHIPDSDCKYDVVLFRKPKNNYINLPENAVYISSSNNLQTPNDHILFDTLGKTVFFRNVKNNEIEKKDISSLSFMKNIGKVYNIYDLYKEIYKNELTDDKLGSSLSSSKMSS